MAKKKKRKKSSPVLTVLILVCLAVCLFSAYKLGTTLLEYKRGTDEYRGLRQYTAERISEETADPDSLSAVSVGQELKCPISADFDALRAINEDIVGWIYIQSLDISYPIVHGDDNDYYLHRTFERQYNFAGSIFMEADNNPDFQDPHTIIYGHNMKNNSMFGKLDQFIDKPETRENPYFWILTPEKDYCYQMFSMERVAPDSDVYTLFHGTDQMFVEYAKKRAAASSVELPEQSFTEESKLVTLSTCTGDSVARFVVQGVRIGSAAHVS